MPTLTGPSMPRLTAIQRPTVAVRQKSLDVPVKPKGLMTYGAPATVESAASYFRFSALSEMLR